MGFLGGLAKSRAAGKGARFSADSPPNARSMLLYQTTIAPLLSYIFYVQDAIILALSWVSLKKWYFLVLKVFTSMEMPGFCNSGDLELFTLPNSPVASLKYLYEVIERLCDELHWC